MKTLLALGVAVCAVTLSGSQQYSSARVAGITQKESAVAEFKIPVKLMGAVLQGAYMFVHDEQKMQAGEDCTYVYKMEAGRPVKLVVSFHCTPVPRPRVEHFIIRSSLLLTEPLLYELQEYQFAGSSEGHQVPSSTEAKNATVDLVACCQ
jgi:hypothetical protein